MLCVLVNVDKLLNKPSNIYEIFHENSKIHRFPSKEFLSIRSDIYSNEELISMISNSFKRYITSPKIKLDSNPTSNNSLYNTILKRRSVRNFTNKPISLADISKILNMGAGITKQRQIDDKNHHYLRSYPSAGGLYPLEIYPVIFNSNDLELGAYHYDIKNNSLELMESGNHREKISSMTLYPDLTFSSSMTILITAVFPRTTFKYGDRGYRFILMEAGHLAQNFYLICAALNHGCISLGGFIDDDINQFLRIDGLNESIIYVILVGTTDTI